MKRADASPVGGCCYREKLEPFVYVMLGHFVLTTKERLDVLRHLKEALCPCPQPCGKGQPAILEAHTTFDVRV